MSIILEKKVSQIKVFMTSIAHNAHTKSKTLDRQALCLGTQAIL